MNPDPFTLAFYMAELGTGGIGKMTLRVARELIDRGIRVDLVLGNARGPYIGTVDPRIRIFHLQTSHHLAGIPGLLKYMRAARPDAIVCEKLRINLVALRARRILRSPCRILAGIHGIVTHKIEKEDMSRARQRKTRRRIHHCYPQNDGFIAVSRGVADDLIQNYNAPPQKVHVVYNPVVGDDLPQLAQELPDHPWLRQKTRPVIVSVGRLVPQKDYSTLIRAFARVRASVVARLIIIGEGDERRRLEEQARTCPFADDISLPGFQRNPYGYLGRTDVFVLPSRWEGFGNALVEALALGVPSVATDCPVGPREILQNGKLGELVGVGDDEAMAKAILKMIASPPPVGHLISASRRFSTVACADGYLRILGLS